MTLALGGECPHDTTVFRWYRNFQGENFSLKGAEKAGRLQTSVKEENFTDVLQNFAFSGYQLRKKDLMWEMVTEDWKKENIVI